MLRSSFVLLALLALAAPVFAGDEPQFVIDSASQVLQPPPADQAQIVLLEPINKVQGFFPVGVWSLNGDQRTLLTVTSFQTKSVLLLPPGKHRLMSTNMLTKVHFLDATVEAGKRYYVLLRFVYNEGFQLRPIRTTATSDFNMVGADWKEWQTNTPRIVEKGPASDEHFAKEKVNKRLNKLYAKATEAWNKRTDAERAELTLTPADAAPL
jgi:hypothetical protein